jgi:phage tail P2-like protein
MSDLLPHNATPQEVALDDATARVGDVPVVVRELWDPDTCPSALLPWLAWALSVDVWETEWTDDQKRAAIRPSIEVQQRKGTIGAVRAALAVSDISVQVLEWHRQAPAGDAYTYKLLIEALQGAPVASLAQIEDVIASVDRTKSLRSHLDTVEISTASTAGPYLAAAAGMGNEIVVVYGGQLLN